MPTKRTPRTTVMKTTPTTTAGGPQYLTRSDAKEMIDALLRTAFQEHSRSMEQHLRDIHQRLLLVERKP